MLGLVAAGRLVDTSPEMVDENKAMFTILQPENINHVVVFLTGEVPFEDGFGASIFLYWPSIDEEWQLLGHISNDKPSAIFRITGVKPTASGGASGAANPFQAYQMNYNEGVSLWALSRCGATCLSCRVTAPGSVCWLTHADHTADCADDGLRRSTSPRLAWW